MPPKQKTSKNPFQRILSGLDKANQRSSGSAPKLKQNLGSDSKAAQEKRKKRLAAFAKRLQRRR